MNLNIMLGTFFRDVPKCNVRIFRFRRLWDMLSLVKAVSRNGLLWFSVDLFSAHLEGGENSSYCYIRNYTSLV